MEEADIIIAGGTLLTLDDEDRRIEDGAVAIIGDRIVRTGSWEEIKDRFTGRMVLEAKDCLIMPGLVNCHTHAAMTCFRGIADDMELMDWLNRIFPLEKKNVDQELAYWGSLLACVEMIKSGTTTFCDMYVFEEETARAAKQAGMRCLIGEGLLDFPMPNADTPADGLAHTRRLIERWADDPMINIIVQPHSLYACSPDLLHEAKKIADEYGLPYALHLLENESEKAQLQRKFGKKAMIFLEEAGFLTERFLAYHLIAVDEEDISIFADHGCRAVHMPESNMKLASGFAPVPAMLKAGVTVALGTDGCASNNDLDMFREMGMAAKLHKVHNLDPTVMDAKTVVRMATRGGAKALGLADVTGSLEAGKKADVIIIDMRKPHLTPMYNEYSHLVYAASGSDVDTVIINGKLIMKNRRLLDVDEAEVMTRIRDIAHRIKQDLHV